MRWLRRFFYSDDPPVKVAAGLGETEAGMWRELLENNDVHAFTKNMDYLSVTYGGSGANTYDMWVKRSDLERAREILADLVEPAQLVEDDRDTGNV